MRLYVKTQNTEQISYEFKVQNFKDRIFYGDS